MLKSIMPSAASGRRTEYEDVEDAEATAKAQEEADAQAKEKVPPCRRRISLVHVALMI